MKPGRQPMPEIEDPEADLLEAYDYPLPADRIASHPAAERTASRLLVHDRAADRVQHSVFAEIGAHFAPGDLLILNDVRVIPSRAGIGRDARIPGRKRRLPGGLPPYAES